MVLLYHSMAGDFAGYGGWTGIEDQNHAKEPLETVYKILGFRDRNCDLLQNSFSQNHVQSKCELRA